MSRWLLVAVTGSMLYAQEAPLRLTRIASGLRNPTDIQAAHDGSGRLFFVQQDGIIRVMRDGVLLAEPFLDIRDKTRAGGERGLLGLAFPPDFAAKGHFYVHYTDVRGDSVIARYRVRSPNADAADPSSETIVLTQRQPFPNHNGGQLAFGPDGWLYIGFGDGGSAGDPQNNAQNPRTWLGKMLRVDTESDPARYMIPATNPFASGAAALPEIWALGLRNPWRFSFDRETGDLWIADVGQNRVEEINFQPAWSRGGENYGWNLMEGSQCFQTGCRPGPDFVLPVHEYGRSEGISVTGGFVYRGARYPELRGMYIYGDYGSGRIWGLRRENDRWVNRLLLAAGRPISTFGEDEDGELYLADYLSGEIFALQGRPDTGAPPALVPSAVVNAASFQPGLVAGSLATIFGQRVTASDGVRAASRMPLPRMLDGVEVLVNGMRAPVLAVARLGNIEQINFQVPYEVHGLAVVSLTVRRNAVASEAVEAPLLAAQPGIFTTDGTRAIVVHHADHTLVTPERPLRAGELAYFYATGLGEVVQPPPSGAAAPSGPPRRALAPVRVTLGGVDCEVLFAGLAPGLVGVFQVNIRVPASAPRGNLELVVTAAEVSSPAARVPVN
ncbi:MAG: PQQ-dependent sugar dehydrogenase [Bryobacterales bacterium]|nr:PQQ-dependent sugar dehydrogenase [Bryobacteraceae bacterium]MDW8353909.1 PQQ-dependent sugar dehydrogenase [Bryobacterales bacterium]